VECFDYLGSIINDTRCTWEIKYRISIANVTFNKNKALFSRKLGLNLRKKLVKCQKYVKKNTTEKKNNRKLYCKLAGKIRKVSRQ
jgi:hypothetical protein